MGRWSPDIDMTEKDNKVIIRADLPGMESKDIEVNVNRGVLTLRGQRKAEETVKDEDYYCAERWSGAFECTLQLPNNVDVDHIHASFTNGVLEIQMPISQETQAKRIEIGQGQA
jgi:HSP20 family protein